MRKKNKSKRISVLRRVGALLSSLLLCVLLTVPAFASNNASTQKWYIADESYSLTTESGEKGHYFKLTPYVGGEEYAYTFTTSWAAIHPDVISSDTAGLDVWIQPVNYPQVWRSSLPLGANTYVDCSKLVVKSVYNAGIDVTSSYTGTYLVLPFVPSETFTISSSSPFSMAYNMSGTTMCFPYAHWYNYEDAYKGSSGTGVDVATGISISPGSTALKLLSECSQFRYSLVTWSDYVTGRGTVGFDLHDVLNFYNADSSDLAFCVVPYNLVENPITWSEDSYLDGSNGRCVCSMVISFWVDANKLPAGLQVGDEFPANDDAFDQLRDDLLDAFPEAGEHIENDKGSWEGLRDTDTIDENTASTFFQLIGGFFEFDIVQSVALMCAGFIVLVVIIRKALT